MVERVGSRGYVSLLLLSPHPRQGEVSGTAVRERLAGLRSLDQGFNPMGALRVSVMNSKKCSAPYLFIDTRYV